MHLKHLLRAGLMACGLAGLVASAQADSIQFDPDGLGPRAVLAVEAFDLDPSNELWDQGRLAISNGAGSFTSHIQTRLTSLIAVGGSPIPSSTSGLSLTHEVTLVMGFGKQVTAVGNLGTSTLVNLGFDNTVANNYVEFWQGAALDAIPLAGTGFNNGTRILRGTVISTLGFLQISNTAPVAFDQTGDGNQYPGQQTLQTIGNNSSFLIRVDSVDPVYFPDLNPGDIITVSNASQQLPFLSVNPSQKFVSLPGGAAPTLIPVLGTVNGQNGDDIQLQTDFNMTFTRKALPAALGDYVWEDKNGNGVQEVGEPGIDGVSAFLYTCGGDGMVGTGDDVFVNSTSTDINGKYLFPNLLPGSYYVNSISRQVSNSRLKIKAWTPPTATPIRPPAAAIASPWRRARPI